MLHFRMDMPFYLMVIYGSIMIALVLLLRGLLKKRLPGFVFPALWGMVLLRLLVPFSLSSPLSVPMVPMNPLGAQEVFLEENIAQDTSAEIGGGRLQGNVFDGRVLGSAYISNADFLGSEGDGSGSDGSGNRNASGDVGRDGNGRSGSGSTSGIKQDKEVTAIRAEAAEGVLEGGFFSLARWQNLALLVYLAGSAAVIGILIWQKYCYSRKLRSGLLIENNEVVNSILRSMDMGHILVFTSDEIASPMVCGLLNPRIYLPARMDFQDKALLGNIFAHETMHIRRRDNWVKAVMLAVLCVNWYNPLVWIMSKCLSADLETACDEAVLRSCGEEGRKEYARSLLSMAVTGGRTALLYSAFSKTEVEKRIRGVLRYRKATVSAMIFSLLFMTVSGVVFATGGQAPFSSRLTPYCAGAYSRWGVKVSVTRDLALGKNGEERAEEVIFSVLRADETEDPEILEEAIRKGLAQEFGVEKRAFAIELSLCLSQEEIQEEYAAWEITKGEDGFWLYQGERIRVYQDKMLGAVQSREDGKADVAVERDRLGRIVAVTVLRQGDEAFDRRTREIEERKMRW